MSATRRAAYVVGTFDTKGEELRYVAGLVREAGVPVVQVDVGTRSRARDVDVTAENVATHHPAGADAVFATGDRGIAVTAMTEALTRCIAARADIGGMIGLGGSGGTAIITPAMRTLPIGMPKVMVSTLASGNVAPYVDIHDITMMYPVTDVAGLNRVSRVVLGNAAHALAGMMLRPILDIAGERPSLGITMFGVTTPCVQQITAALGDGFDCQVFAAHGPGGRAMEALVAAGMLQGVIDVTTTEIADLLVGGVCSAGSGRLDAILRTGVPWVGSLGALDMVNFWAPETIPEHYRGRLFHVHNPNVTLMRTTADELRQIGAWITAKLNRSPGAVRLLIPENGVSMLDAPGQPFHEPAADTALFDTIERTFESSHNHRIVRLPHHINDAAFAAAVVTHVREVMHLKSAEAQR